MNCPICDRESRVLTKDGVERRRECTGCGLRFTTEERLKEELRRRDAAVQSVLDAAEKIKAVA